MKQSSHNQSLMTQYLLGELPERERDELEERYFSDDELFGELLDAQDQIANDYLRGRFSQPERERFERRFLTLPDRRREVEFANLFDQHLTERRADGLPTAISEPVPRRQSLFSLPLLGWLGASRQTPGWVLAVAVMILIAGAAWSVIKISRLQVQLDQSQARHDRLLEQARNERASLEEELARLKTSAESSETNLSLALSPGASRSSDEIKEVRPGSATQLIEFALAAGAETYAGYQAILQPADDESAEILVYNRPEVKTTRAGKSVIVKTPAAMLETGDYQIKLDGINSQGDAHIIGKYLFQVRRH